MTIIESRSNELVRIRLEFLKPFKPRTRPSSPSSRGRRDAGDVEHDGHE